METSHPTNLLEALAFFCEIELALRDTEKTYKDTCASITCARTRAYNMLSRTLLEDDTPWVRLREEKGYLHVTHVKTQCALKESVVSDAVNAALQTHVKEGGPNMPKESARDHLLRCLKKEVRDARTTTHVAVKHVDVLPRKVKSVCDATKFVEDNFNLWCDAKTKLASVHGAHVQHTAVLKKQRTAMLEFPGVQTYLKGVGSEGQPVTLKGHDDNKFVLKHTIKTRRCYMRESHVQQALKDAVQKIFDDEGEIHSNVLTQLILSGALEKAGTETMDVFSLRARGGRPRAAVDV
jgi:hypothetical protein